MLVSSEEPKKTSKSSKSVDNDKERHLLEQVDVSVECETPFVRVSHKGHFLDSFNHEDYSLLVTIATILQ
jgi:hypothetical protein